MELVWVPKKSEKIPAVMNITEVTSFLNHCTSLKEKTMFTLIYSSGIRIGELVQIKIGHIDFERKQSLSRTEKEVNKDTQFSQIRPLYSSKII